MKIQVVVDVSQSVNSFTIDLNEMNLTEHEWADMNDAQKHSALQQAIDERPDQPYWVIDEYKEKD